MKVIVLLTSGELVGSVPRAGSVSRCFRHVGAAGDGEGESVSREGAAGVAGLHFGALSREPGQVWGAAAEDSRIAESLQCTITIVVVRATFCLTCHVRR